MNKKITTSLPLSVEVSETKGDPQVILSSVGELELKQTIPGTYKSDFHLSMPGVYTLTIRDKGDVESLRFTVEQHQFLDFQNEFGSFLILFLVTMGGIVLWTRRIMKKKTV